MKQIKEILGGIVKWFGVLILFITALVFGGALLRFTWNFFQFGWNLLG
jgi:hypothetical protein